MFGGKKAPTLPDVPTPLTKPQLRALVWGPNGRALGLALLKGEVERCEQFANWKQDAEAYIAWLQRMEAASLGVIEALEDMLAEVEA